MDTLRKLDCAVEKTALHGEPQQVKEEYMMQRDLENKLSHKFGRI